MPPLSDIYIYGCILVSSNGHLKELLQTGTQVEYEQDCELNPGLFCLRIILIACCLGVQVPFLVVQQVYAIGIVY